MRTLVRYSSYKQENFQVANNFNRLKVDELRYLGPLELTQYYIKHTNFTQMEFDDHAAVFVFVVLGRRFLSNFLTIYLPTILLNIVGHITVYFKVSTLCIFMN